MACKKRDGSPRKGYRFAGEAEESARYLEQKAGEEFMHYRCTDCELWHVSPLSNYTPGEKCEDCGKAGYETREAAERRAERILEERDVKLNVYPCPYDNGWHLTKNEQW